MQKETDDRQSGDILLGAMGAFSVWHWLIVAVVVILLFGRNKISSVMGDFAQGIKSFKRGMAEDDKPTTVADGRAAEPADGVQAEETRRRIIT